MYARCITTDRRNYRAGVVRRVQRGRRPARIAQRRGRLWKTGHRHPLRPARPRHEDALRQTKLVECNRYSECLTALLAGLVDAITTGDVILAGYAAQNPELLRAVGKPFTKDAYGIGLRKGDPEGKAKVNAALQKMISSGAWRTAAQANLGASGYRLPPPAITER